MILIWFDLICIIVSPINLCCTLLSCAAPYRATLHPTELRRILLSYAAPYWATMHPTELRWTLLSYTAPYLAKLQHSELLCTLSELVRYRNKGTQSGAGMLRYWTVMMNDGMPIPAALALMPILSYEVEHTVKSSNFVILFSENIFFLQTFFRWPYFVFWYWNLSRMCLAIVYIHFALRQCLIPKMLFFLRLTKLGDRHLISSPSQINITKQEFKSRGW